MPFPMKIQPIDNDSQPLREPVRPDSIKPVLKSRLKRLFDLQLPSVLRISSTEKPIVGAEFEPSSVCLDKMVQSFIEESNEKQSTVAAAAAVVKCGRNRCNCFNGNNSSDDEFDAFGEPINGGGGDASDILKSLILCASVAERNLLADTAMIVEKNKNIKRKDDLRKIVTDSLQSLNYNSSVCKSKWDKSSNFPAGEYEYIDVIVEGGERVLIDVDFRSEFEIARSTGAYKAILQSLPFIFVGKTERLGQIVSIVSEAAKQSLKKKGMYFPPWRKAEYMRAKWLSNFTRNDAVEGSTTKTSETQTDDQCLVAAAATTTTTEADCGGELDLIFGEETTPLEEEENNFVGCEVMTWHPPAVKPKSVERGTKIVTGLASLLKERA